MEFLRIDFSACTGCGLCSRACPLHLIIQEEPGEPPVPRKGKEEACIACGHCMSVCPGEALEVGPLSARDFIPVRRELRVSPEQAVQFLRTRRSVRAYSDKPVSREDLLAALDVARWAPSGHHSQPVRWTLLASRDAVLEAASLTANWMRGQVEAGEAWALAMHLDGVVRAFDNGKDLICRGAPALAMAVAPQPGGHAPTPREDAIIAVAYAELAAHGLGLGACWAGYVVFAAQHHTPLREYLEAPEGYAVYGGLMLGRPAFRYSAIPPRKELEVVVKS
jgi:nitroreductase/NAD-dependent dihydropyrimidine dehydrogenase PreA subunit